MDLFFVLKLIVVLFFLVMFLRNSRAVWGIGLLTVSTAFLLDTVWSTFGRDEIVADIGFFFYILSGALFAGAAIWLWTLLRPLVGTNMPAVVRHDERMNPANPGAEVPSLVMPETGSAATGDDTYADPRELFHTIRTRLGPEDVRDLIFDLQLNENEVLSPNQEIVHTITRIVNRAYEQDQMGALALAVERILTPVPPENLPRREKLTSSSPPTVLRHFLLAHYSLDGLKGLAKELDIDYQHFDHGNKSQMARNLLRYVQRRNKVNGLLAELQSGADLDEEE